MLRQPVHRLPQLGFGRVAEDLGGLADPLVRVDEAEPGAPDTPVVASDAEEQGDKPIGQAEGESSWRMGSREPGAVNR